MLKNKYYLIATLFLVITMFSSCSFFSSSPDEAVDNTDKDKCIASINKGLALQAQKRYDDALTAFREAIEYDRFSTDAYFYASYVSFLLKDMEGTYYYANKSIKIDKGFADGYLMASQVLLDRKRYKDALTMLSKLVSVPPKKTNHLYKDKFSVYYRMGICYIGLSQYKTGLDALKKSVKFSETEDVPRSLVRSAKDMIRKVERRMH